jgi:hypothetical protein
MENLICSFCLKEYSTKYSLNKHQEKCSKNNNLIKNLEKIEDIDNSNNVENKNQCKICDKVFTTSFNLSRHQETCKDFNTVLKEYKSLRLKYTKNLQKIEEKDNLLIELKEEIVDLNLTKSNLQSKLEIYKNLEDIYKEQISKLEQTIEKLASKAIENTGPKTTTINNRNQVYQALQPLTDDHMRDQTQHLTYKDVKNGIEGIAYFASNYTFKDRVFCSDKSRLNFVFKNEDDVIIKDPEGIEITNKFIEINKNELLRFLEEYFSFIKEQLDKDLDIAEYKHWAKRREEIITVKSAVRRGNIPENKDSYDEFKRSFLSVLSELVPR